MRILLVSLMLLVCTMVFPNPRNKYHYRPAPKTGEIVCVAGLLTVATGAALTKDCSDDFKQSMVFVGLGMCVTGIIIDLDGHKKGKRKNNKRLFATGSRIGVTLRF